MFGFRMVESSLDFEWFGVHKSHSKSKHQTIPKWTKTTAILNFYVLVQFSNDWSSTFTCAILHVVRQFKNGTIQNWTFKTFGCSVFEYPLHIENLREREKEREIVSRPSTI